MLRSIVDMFKALALYPMPSDPQAFRDHYESIHLPLVAKLPGVRSLRYSFDLNAPLGESPFVAVFEVEWDNAETMGASLTSPEGQAVAEDMAPYVTKGTVLLNYSLQDADTPFSKRRISLMISSLLPRAAGPGTRSAGRWRTPVLEADR